jgi:hypothetical protein
LPEFLFPDKPRYTESYNTLVYYGLIDPEGGKFPTLPLAGQAYASYGWAGLLTIPFMTFCLFLGVLKKLGWHLHRNIYGVFFFCSFVIVYVSQGDFAQYVGASLRNFPLFTVMFLLMARVCRFRLRHPHHHVLQERRETWGPADGESSRDGSLHDTALTKAR